MSDHLNLNGNKKRKRGERVFRFKIFGENGYPVEFDGSFNKNIKALLEFGHFDSNICNGMASWSFQLEINRQSPLHVILFVIEELIEKSLEHHHCKECRCIGWGQQMICNKIYHFVLPSKDTISTILNMEHNLNGTIATTCEFNLVKIKGHTMHGVFHSNGFGHLLCINGKEFGSSLAGRHVMEFWDRICTGLRARKVSLNDNSKKRDIELRLLHGVAYGEPWFGRWGYKFERGTFGVTKPMYQKAIETLQGMPLCILVHYLGNHNHQIPITFSRYQTLSDHSLVTLNDLFHFMLELKIRLPNQERNNNIDNDSYNVESTCRCRWSPKRIEMTTRVIVEALKRSKLRWVSRQEVRDAARAYIGDTGLLDFVLKSLGNHVVGNYLVRRCLNPVTKVLEYRLEDVSNVLSNQQCSVSTNSKMNGKCKMTRSQLIKDILYLYECILKDSDPTRRTGILGALQEASRIISDAKYFLKEYNNGEILPWRVELGLEGKLYLYCTIAMEEENFVMPPFECFILKNDTTFDELKQEVERNFKDMYWRLRNFRVESIVNCNIAIGTDMVFGQFTMGQKIIFKGRNDREGGEMICGSGGINDPITDCLCGAKEDDGERMVSCDICEVWQHTRCVKIPNHQEIPPIFLCYHCEHEITTLPSIIP